MEAFKARRIRIIDAGLHNYTGDIGGVEFELGLSVDEVHWIEANRIAANIHVEDADTPGYQLGEIAQGLRNRELPADDRMVAIFEQGEQIDGEIKLALEHFSRADLEQIADAQGLTGVRELARKWGRTGRSIKECIDAVIEAQGAATVESSR